MSSGAPDAPQHWSDPPMVRGFLFEPLPPPEPSPPPPGTPTFPGDSLTAAPPESPPETREPKSGRNIPPRLRGIPRDFIDLTQSYGPDEPVLRCPHCEAVVNDRAQFRAAPSESYLLNIHGGLRCPQCRRRYGVNIVSGPNGRPQWQTAPNAWRLTPGLDYKLELEALNAQVLLQLASGDSLARIVETVSPFGGRAVVIDSSRVLRIARSPGVAGVYRWGRSTDQRHWRRWLPESWPGRFWAAARRRVAGLTFQTPDGRWIPGSRSNSGPVHSETILVCGFCGRPLERELRTGGGSDPTAQMRLACPQRRHEGSPCRLDSTRLFATVSQRIDAELIQRLSDSRWIESLRNSVLELVTARWGPLPTPQGSSGRFAQVATTSPPERAADDHPIGRAPKGTHQPPAPNDPNRTANVPPRTDPMNAMGSGGRSAPAPPWEQCPPQGEHNRVAAPGAQRTSDVTQWLAALRALTADLTGASPSQRRFEFRKLEQAQWASIRSARLARFPDLQHWIHQAAILADRLKAEALDPARLGRVVSRVVIREEFRGTEPIWTAQVQWHLGQLLGLLDPVHLSLALGACPEAPVATRTVVIDAPPLSRRPVESRRPEELPPESRRPVPPLILETQIPQPFWERPAAPQAAGRRPRSPRRREQWPELEQREQELENRLPQRIAQEQEFTVDPPPWTARGDRKRLADLRTVVNRAVRGEALLEHLNPRPLRKALEAGDPPDFELEEAAHENGGEGESVGADLSGPGAPLPFPQAPGLVTPDDTSKSIWVIPRPGAHPFFPRPFRSKQLDEWARQGIALIRPRYLTKLTAARSRERCWTAALDAHFRGCAIPRELSGDLEQIRDAVAALESYRRGAAHKACPLGGALWLKHHGGLDRVLTEARLEARCPADELEQALGYPAAWFDVYRQYFWAHPAEKSPRPQSQPGQAPLEVLRTFLLDVAQSGLPRLERVLAGLAAWGHFRGSQKFRRSDPIPGPEELAVYEILFQRLWLRPRQKNIEAVAAAIGRLEIQQHRARKRWNRAESQVDIKILKEGLEATEKSVEKHLGIKLDRPVQESHSSGRPDCDRPLRSYRSGADGSAFPRRSGS